MRFEREKSPLSALPIGDIDNEALIEYADDRRSELGSSSAAASIDLGWRREGLEGGVGGRGEGRG